MVHMGSKEFRSFFLALSCSNLEERVKAGRTAG